MAKKNVCRPAIERGGGHLVNSAGDAMLAEFGSMVAAWCALIRPDIFRSVALMSGPFAGARRLPLGPPTEAPRAWAAHPVQ